MSSYLKHAPRKEPAPTSKLPDGTSLKRLSNLIVERANRCIASAFRKGTRFAEGRKSF